MNEYHFNSPKSTSKQDDASSIYSRLTKSAAEQPSGIPSQYPHNMLPDYPEINQIDNTIRAFRGSTIALETMRSRVQAAKTQNVGPPHDRWKQLEKELDCNQHENHFYGMCYNIYRRLHSRVTSKIDVLQDLILRSYFEPESIRAHDRLLYDTIREMNYAVKESQLNEAQAEAEFKKYWKIPNTADPSVAWI